MQTLRIRNNEPVVVEEVNDSKVRATEKINELLENFMGINDSDLGKHYNLYHCCSSSQSESECWYLCPFTWSNLT